LSERRESWLKRDVREVMLTLLWASLLSFALRELWRRKFRTAGNILGYAIAVAVITAVVSVAKPYVGRTVNLLLKTGTHLAAYSVDRDYDQNKGFGPVADGQYTLMMHEPELEKLRQIPGVEDVAPYLLYHEDSRVHSREPPPRDGKPPGEASRPPKGENLTIGGLDIHHIATGTAVCGPGEIIEGRYLTDKDKDAVILEEAFAKAKKLKVGDTLKAFGLELRVVGIANTFIRPGKANMYAPISLVRQIMVTARCIKEDAGDLNIALVEVKDARDVERVQKAVHDTLLNTTVLSYNCFVPARQAVAITYRTAWIITVILVVFVTLFAAKSQLSSVSERTREIGLLKAIGWPSSFVMRQIMLESIIQALVGAVVGYVMAYPVASALPPPAGPAGSAPYGTLLVPWAVLLGGVLALAGGIVAGIFPARKASRLSPAEALRRL